ncbi:GntR family transcriptional regulator [Streptacidiphilus monticola]
MSQPDGTLLNYERIAEDLKQQIRDNALPPGAALPSQSQLMKQYGASSLTVQKAMSLLRDGGWAVSRPGKGAFVSHASPQQAGQSQEDVVRRTVADLKEHILVGIYPPGSQLPGGNLAAQLKTGASLVYTALRELAAEHWVSEIGETAVYTVTSADDPEMAARLAQHARIQAEAAEQTDYPARVNALEDALNGALEQIAELRERVEHLEASGSTPKTSRRKTS